MVKEKKKFVKNDYYSDYERLSENIENNYGDDIYNQDDYNDAFDDYLSLQKDKMSKGDYDKLKNQSWKFYSSENKNITPRHKKQLKLKRTQAQKRKLTTLKKEATPSKRIIKEKGKPKKVLKFSYLGKQKGKTIYARKIQTKKGVRYIDKRGRFVRKIKKTI